MEHFFAELDKIAAVKWAEIHKMPFWQHLRNEGLNRELYYLLMREIYHYTRHNTQNQALAAVNVFSDQLPLLRFATHHAYAEAGHDQMVIHDLAAADYDTEPVANSRPLPESLAFISYLYRIAMLEGAVARLGYSYWAESCYTHIRDLTDAMRAMGLGDDQMTFFVEHSTIDEAHFNGVRRAIKEAVRSEEDRVAIRRVLEESLHLQGLLLDGVFRAYVAGRALAATSR
ncbi:iron-containing redox enzyme family protein [Frankia sp. AgB32]|uniref:iron-containing redox enzyme family protein n=1 Tax=Frankia sp. AgB32 TaxID=631119 RepID=UPI00200C0F46|nr:iron-containing redox enzyme family protein [Frankia sp. AgB32]MCK9895091.1 iron-containing redox enzyme family protein [Frankia sp. AgB32]